MTSTSNAPRRARRWARNPILGLVLVLGMLAGIVALNATANADTTVQPSGPGAVLPGAEYLVRDSQATIDVKPGAFMYNRSSSSASFAATSPALGALVCRGDVGPITAVGSNNNSPRTEVSVSGPAGFTPVTFLSPARDAGILTGPFQTPEPYQPIANQASGPNTWRGGVPPTNSAVTAIGTTTAVPNPGLGFQATLDLAGAPSGVYTVTTVHKDIVRTGTFGACTLGYPTQTGFGSQTPIPIPTYGNTFTAGNRTVVHKFEYRPWQQEFKDVLGNGGVNFNTTPVAESQFSIVPANAPQVFSTIKAGGFRYYSLPSNETFMLPDNPQDCLADLASCLGPNASPCDPSTGCEPRLVGIGRHDDGENLYGIFDLQSRAFIALAKTHGSSRILFSLGTQLDALYHDTLDGLVAQADSAGIDLGTLLSTQVILRGSGQEWTLSLLNGLQIDPRGVGRNGIEIVTDYTVQAGIIIHTYAQVSPGACAARSASSAAGDTTFLRSTQAGYNVAGTPIALPDTTLPGVPLPVGGQVFLIEGNMTGVGANTAILAGLGVDVDHGAPSGLPYWVLPADGLLRSHSPRHFEYLGTAAWTAKETPIDATSCMVSGGLSGIGVMIDNPIVRLPLAQLLARTDNPQVTALMNQLTAAVIEAGGPVLTNPTIQELLASLVGTVLGAA